MRINGNITGFLGSYRFIRLYSTMVLILSEQRIWKPTVQILKSPSRSSDWSKTLFSLVKLDCARIRVTSSVPGVGKYFCSKVEWGLLPKLHVWLKLLISVMALTEEIPEDLKISLLIIKFGHNIGTSQKLFSRQKDVKKVSKDLNHPF